MEVAAWLITFASTHEAFAFEDAAQADALAGRIVPLPAAISAGCGLSWKTPPDAPGLAAFLAGRSVRYQEVFRYGGDRSYHRMDRP